MLFLGKKTESPEASVSMTPFSEVNGQNWTEKLYPPVKIPVSSSAISLGSRVCGNIECTNSWLAPWRNRKRPIFEAQWGCSGRCVLSLVRVAIERESKSRTKETPTTHQHRIPLGLLLLSQGWISHSQLQYALRIQKERGRRIGEVLIAECGVEEDLITRGLSLQWSRPVLSTNNFSPRAMALVMPKIFVEESGMLPLRIAASHILYVGFEDFPDASTILALEKMTGLRVESGLIKTEEYRTIQKAFQESEGIEVRQESFSETDALAARIAAVLEQKQPIASRLVRIHQLYWLRLWLETQSIGLNGTIPRSSEDMIDYVFAMN